MVREVWIGYFPPHFNEDMIVQVLSKYIKITRDNIDLKRKNQNFAFVKCQTTADAFLLI